MRPGGAVAGLFLTPHSLPIGGCVCCSHAATLALRARRELPSYGFMLKFPVTFRLCLRSIRRQSLAPNPAVNACLHFLPRNARLSALYLLCFACCPFFAPFPSTMLLVAYATLWDFFH